VALAATLAFYLQAIVSGSLNAGFVYTGDFWTGFIAELAQINTFLSHWVFSGIDLSTHGGAGEFFLRPNLSPYHPLVLLYCLLFHPNTPEQLIRSSVILLFLHSFAGSYFALRLVLRYLKLGLGPGIFIALGYTFSVQMAHSMVQPVFVFCAAMLPWAIYGGIATSDALSTKRAVIYSLPVFVMLTGGYVALGVSCVVLAWGFIAAYILYIQNSSGGTIASVRRLMAGTAPFAIAGFVAAPLYWAILDFHSLVRTSSTSLHWSAHMLSELPRTVLRLLSSRISYEGPLYEFTLYWGIIPVVIMVIFFLGSRDTDGLSESEWRLLRTCGTVYSLMALAIYGNYSAVSDLLYFVPGIGKMHIYQRHLLAGHFFLVVATAIMLKGVAQRKSKMPAKVAFLLLIVVMALSAHLLAINSPVIDSLRINDYFVFELLLGVLFTAALLLRSGNYAFLAGAFLVLLVPLDHIYDYSDPASNVKRRDLIVLDKANNSRVVSYFKTQSHKPIKKYVDLTPGLRDYLSKNYPWFVSKDVQLASYGGYEFSLAARAEYLSRMITTVRPGDSAHIMLPDWNWLARTGAEFVVYQDGYTMNDPRLREVAHVSDGSRVLRLPHNIVIAPLKLRDVLSDLAHSADFGGGLVTGRYVRVQLTGTDFLSLAEVRVMGRRGGNVVNLAQGKAATQSSLLGSGHAAKAVDGNTSGDNHIDGSGSVTHTLNAEMSEKQGGHQANAWWQVDLGSSATIDAVEIWNRTDCCSERLKDYWVFVSDTPFAGSDTPATLRRRPGTRSSHQTTAPNPFIKIVAEAAKPGAFEAVLFDNGYLRVLGAANGAVVAGFHTDGATAFDLDLDASQPVKVQYLFWPNDRLRFSLQGQPVNSVIEDGLQTVSIPAGHIHLEIRYVCWPLRAFLLLYFLYALSIPAALIMAVVALVRQPVTVKP
jgi:hypothetical protein